MKNKKSVKPRQCSIPGCPNKTDQGEFVGDFCAPCYDYVVGKSTGGPRNPSQAWKNEMVKANFRFISSMRSKGYDGHERDRERLAAEIFYHVFGLKIDMQLMKDAFFPVAARDVAKRKMVN